MQFHHVGISVSNLERSIAFYEDMLGMKLVSGPHTMHNKKLDLVNNLKDVRVRSCHVSAGGATLELFEYANPVGAPKDPMYSVADLGISHFGVVVEDIYGLYDKMVAAGVVFHSPVQVFPSGMRAAYGRDLDGNVFEMLEQGPPLEDGSSFNE